MFCEKCGSKLQEGDVFCENCGERVPDMAVAASKQASETFSGIGNSDSFSNPRQQNNAFYSNANQQYEPQSKNPYHPSKPKKSSKKKIVVGTVSGVAAAAVITSGIVTYNIFTSPSYKVAKLVKDEKYDEAYQMYKSFKREPAFVEKLTNTLIKKLDSIKKEFVNKKISYEDAKSQLEEIGMFGFPSVQTHIIEVSEYLDDMSKSFESFDKGMEAMDEENYADAIKYLKDVVEDDPDYNSAEDNLKKAMENYSKAVLAEVDELVASNDYKNALIKINIALDAISSLAENGEDKELKESFDKNKGLYVSEVLVQAQDEKAKENYDVAISIIQEAIGITDDQSLKTELAALEAEKPMTLEELKLSESENFTQITDLAITEDVVGNKYSPNNLFQISARADGWGSGYEGYADYYLNYKYKRLKGTIAVADTSETTNATLTIYGDKNIIYTSGTMNRTTPPKEIDIDLSNVDWLEFKLTMDEEAPNGTVNILLSNLRFIKQ